MQKTTVSAMLANFATLQHAFALPQQFPTTFTIAANNTTYSAEVALTTFFTEDYAANGAASYYYYCANNAVILQVNANGNLAAAEALLILTHNAQTNTVHITVQCLYTLEDYTAASYTQNANTTLVQHLQNIIAQHYNTNYNELVC